MPNKPHFTGLFHLQWNPMYLKKNLSWLLQLV